jgi:hypothetical protein
VFTESGGSWTEVQELTAPDGGPGDVFGYSVALSLDSTTALIGARFKNNVVGAAYVFKQGGGTWTQAQELTPSDDGGVFGQSVGLSHDGSVALIGASINNGAMGAAYVFTEPSSRLPYKSSRNR